jgi:DNA adenine methylase
MLPVGKRLIEPFAGSAAVFLNSEYPQSLIADSNADLITLYLMLKGHGEDFIAYCQTLFNTDTNHPAVYYALREEFNSTQDGRRKAALFLYLNRHGYNGLCRYNSKGKFNVPFGRYKKPYFPTAEMLGFYHKAQNAVFQVADFRDVMRSAVPGDVVYCDPPYVPLSLTAHFTSYARAGFGQDDQIALTTLAEELAGRGISVIISNHVTDFTLHSYRRARCERFMVQRFISSNGKKRAKAREVLALFEAQHAWNH